MLKNIFFCILLILGIWVTLKDFPLGIIYNFCVIFIYNYFYLFEGFKTCNFNIPDSIVSDSPFIIQLAGQDSECPEETGEENLTDQTLTISSTERSFVFSQPIAELPQRLNIGDQIRIIGAQVNSSQVFTISDVGDTYFKVKEEVSGNYFVNTGMITIVFEILNLSSSSIIYNKKIMKEQVYTIDENNTKNNSNLEEISNLKSMIDTANSNIQTDETNIKKYQDLITKNKSKIFSNSLDVQNKPDLISFITKSIDNDSTPSKNYEQKFNRKYRKLMSQNSDLEDTNNNLTYQIENSKLNIQKNIQTKCKLRRQIDKLFIQSQRNDKKSLRINDSLTTQNNNFNRFMNSCKVPKAPIINFSPLKSPVKKC